MINNLLYYTTYILYSRIYPPNNNWKFRSAIIPLIEPLHSNYKPIEVYNMDISLPLNYQSPRTIISVESSSDRILGFPLFVRSFYKTYIQKVFNQKNTGLYFKNYKLKNQILKQTTTLLIEVFKIICKKLKCCSY